MLKTCPPSVGDRAGRRLSMEERVWRKHRKPGTNRNSKTSLTSGKSLIALYAGEQMLAFFEFTLERPGNEALSGLCRVAQPKRHRSALRYLSLSFLVDTPDSATRPVVRKALALLEGVALKTAVPDMTDGAIISSLNSSTESYIAQTDLLLGSEVNKAFIMTKLIPAIARIAQLHLTHVEWWEESPPSRLPSARFALPAVLPAGDGPGLAEAITLPQPPLKSGYFLRKADKRQGYWRCLARAVSAVGGNARLLSPLPWRERARERGTTPSSWALRHRTRRTPKTSGKR